MKKVYLSFAEVDTEKVKNLLPLFNSFEYALDYYEGLQDLDFNAPEAAEIKQVIGEKIVQCSIAVCLISAHTHECKWVDLALMKNRNKGNRIIAMALKGTTDAVLPKIIHEENLTFYPWDPERLKELIARDTHKFYNNST